MALLDARDFALFEARDELPGLGVDAAQIDGFDAQDDAALDHHIGQAHAVATAPRNSVPPGRPCLAPPTS